MKRKPYIVAMIILVAAYLAGHFFAKDYIDADSISMVLAIIAAVAFWMEFENGQRVNEAKLIMELNDQFVGNPQFNQVEWELEKYYDAYKKEKAKGGSADDLTLGLNLDISCEDRQHLVNYLVHLEGIATLVSEEILHLKVISNLMAYRYFIAVNNPIIQQVELLPNKDYYRGIFQLYEKWSKELGEDRIPMAEHGLVKKDVESMQT